MLDSLSFDTVMLCLGDGWTPRIGDPNLAGWLTVAAYLLCALLAIGVANRYPPAPGRGFWALLIVLMLFLAVNKQLDLQSAITATGRCIAREQGWYGQRRSVQMAFIMAMIAVSGTVLLVLLIAMRRSLVANFLALTGLAILMAFVLSRAVGFHHMDRLISREFLNIRYNYLFENAGLLLIAVNAILLLRIRPRDRSAKTVHSGDPSSGSG